jgi:hypothetical protein
MLCWFESGHIACNCRTIFVPNLNNRLVYCFLNFDFFLNLLLLYCLAFFFSFYFFLFFIYSFILNFDLGHPKGFST